ncbi:hypothetical protein AXX17_AT4G15870 [Arabidopsis thaliana]|uniref:Leucine-rich repeat-containing N-terminal plant-type domain-containing protein n=1 Tax=Arabidopsis thaliana TaxID=3702 RepID=A0A178USB9_ARATH|nr:hypothetical protein AXX17_AT4G15870 [Arabidopsis thaliana]
MITIKWSLCLIFYLSNSIIVIAKHLCLPDQRDALWEFKNEFYVQEFDPSANGDTDIEKWRNNTDCCSWDGVSCDPKTGVVVELDLEFNGLNGPLRSNSSLFRLQHLQILDLGSNNIWGTLPDSIGNLKYLRFLSFKDCNLYGKIPSSLGSLSYLARLLLPHNDFTSEPTDSVGNLNQLTDFQLMLLNLSSLIWIDLGDNQFRGMLPSNMSSLSKLKYFDIGGNSFSGTIPSSLFMLPSLVELDLRRNHFRGPLEIGNVSSQSNLSLQDQVLSWIAAAIGYVPGVVCGLTIDQRDSLWGFKNEFHVPSEKWRNNTDCCSWDGVSCDPKTGNVVGLDLAGSDLNGPLRSNSSLFRLQHLQKLYLGYRNRIVLTITSFGSLSYNDGLKGELPDSIGNLKYLKVLSLRGCHLFGKIPSSLGNLSYLTHLDLSYNDFTRGPDSMGNLNRLTDMLLRLSSLIWINLGNNQFRGMLPSNMSSLSKLKYFDISGNSFSGTIPSSLFMLPSLVELGLRRNHFSGPLEIGNISSQSKLQLLHLGRNNFNGPIPSSLGSLSYLTHLDLSDNEFTSEPPDSMGNLNRLTDSLTWIDLRDNKFRGILPSSMSSLSKLEYIFIGGNSFSGTIPSSLFMLPSLVLLDLGGNHFTGPLEIGNISSQSNLQHLNIGRNNFNPGIVDLSIFSPLLSLGHLDLSGINLKISSTVSLPSSIYTFILSSCNISEFPKFLRNQTMLSYLDISANQIEGQVPEWLWSLPELRYVNISHNSFNGFEGPADVIQERGELHMLDISSNTFQDPFPLLPVDSMIFLFSSNNRFSGEIPRTICELDNLVMLVLSNNNFSGSIPRCFENLTLSVLHLRNNSLSGIFPEEAISHRLQSFDVGHNLFSGELPKSLINCSALEFLNVEDNRINDTFPSWLRLLPNLQMLVLRSNEFHGPISSPRDSVSFPKLRIFDISENHFNGVLSSDYFDGWTTMLSVVVDFVVEVYILGRSYPKSVDLTNKGLKMELVGSGFKIYKTIDVSGNRLEGDIPESISLLKELIVLNMSNNAFTGHIPPSLSNLSNLQSLDLSQNRLSGSIPPELGKLTFLARMNFSHNRLEGPIPQTTQIQTQDSSSFTENPGLCGLPLKKTCGREEDEEATKQEQDEDKEEEDKVFSWIAAAIGYVPGLFCGLAIAHILTSYKRDWFMRIFSAFLLC